MNSLPNPQVPRHLFSLCGIGNITVNVPMVVHHADLLVQGVTQGGTVVEAFRTSDGVDLWTLSSSTAQSGAHISGTYGSYRDRLHISVRLATVSAFNVDSQQMVCVAALPSGGVVSGLGGRSRSDPKGMA